MTQPVIDVASNLEENLQRWGRSLAGGGKKLRVFELVYSTKKKQWSSAEIASSLNLSKKDAVTCANRLVGDALLKEVPGFFPKIYSKLRDVQHHKKRILSLAADKKRRDAIPTKRSPKITSGHLFPKADLVLEKSRVQRLSRRSIGDTLKSFAHFTEARTVDTMWVSRKTGTLRPNPEKVAQGLLTQYIGGTLSASQGQVDREVASGVGFVDLVVRFGVVPHLVELKVQTAKFIGPKQLATYMKNESRREGWLVVFDARPPHKKSKIAKTMKVKEGTIHVIVIDINPIPPSQKNK